MADVGKPIRADASLTLTTIYIVPASTKFYIKTINVNNPTAESQAFDLRLGDKDLASNLNVPKYGGARDDDTHVLVAGETIKFAATDTSMDIIIDGVEES